MLSGPGGRLPPGKRPTSSRPPDVGDRRWPEGCKPGQVYRGFILARLVWVHPGDVHFSQDHFHPPILHPIALQCSDWAETALIPQRTNKLKTNHGDSANWQRPAVPIKLALANMTTAIHAASVKPLQTLFSMS